MKELNKDPVFYSSITTLYVLCALFVYFAGHAESVIAALVAALVPWLIFLLPWTLATAFVVSVVDQASASKR